MTEKNKDIARQFYEIVINKGDLIFLETILSENFIDHYASPELQKGIEGFKQFLTIVSTAFPDIKSKIEDIIAEDDKVVVRLSFNGTQMGELTGDIPPSGKQASWSGIDILQIKDGKITDRWSQRDLLSLYRQIDAF